MANNRPSIGMQSFPNPPPPPPPPPKSMQFRSSIPPPPLPLQSLYTVVGRPPRPQYPKAVTLQPLQPPLLPGKPPLLPLEPPLLPGPLPLLPLEPPLLPGPPPLQPLQPPLVPLEPPLLPGPPPFQRPGSSNMTYNHPPMLRLEHPISVPPWLLREAMSRKPATSSQPNVEQKEAEGPTQCLPNSNQKVQSDASLKTEDISADKGKNIPTGLVKKASTYWKVYTSHSGRFLGKKYYYNKRTKVSSWEKPVELMTENERADATTDWRELTSPDGLRYYYNTVNKESKWDMPDDVKLARNPVEGIPIIADVSVTEQDRIVHITSPMKVFDVSPQEDRPSSVKDFMGNVEEANKSLEISGNEGSSALEEKKVEHAPLVYESEEEAKKAFLALLETANVGSDWNWERVMGVIINDSRYDSLNTIEEKMQTFHEFMGQKKKQEAEDKRARRMKAREDFKKMLQESKDLTPSTKWSKAECMFEGDERFQAVDRVKDREELFEDHLDELEKKERAEASEKHKRHKAEYLEYLKSCDFIMASSIWRKVQHRLEDDERFSRLEKIERMQIFQEYTHDLEFKEEEMRKLRMEELRKTERKNRDEFRKLLEEHVTGGILTMDCQWRSYSVKVEDHPAFLSVSSNTSGSTAKDLFDDVIEDLEKQYLEDEERIEEAIRNENISLSITWTLEDFKNSLSKEISVKPISDTNLKLVYDHFLEIAKADEEKVAKKRKRLAEDIRSFLFTSKEISSSSKWEDCKHLVKERFKEEGSFLEEVFDKAILSLKERKQKRKEEKAKMERERKSKEKGRDRRDKVRKWSVEKRKRRDRQRKMDESDSDESESYSLEENKRSRDRTKRLKQAEKDGEMESETQSKRQKRDRWNRDSSDKTTAIHREERKDDDTDEEVEVT